MTLPARTLKEYDNKKTTIKKVSGSIVFLATLFFILCLGLTAGSIWYQYFYLENIYSLVKMPKSIPQKWAGGVFRIEVLKGGKVSYGTGFLVGEQIVLTNAHVVGNAKNVRLFTDSKKEKLTGRVYWVGGYKDTPHKDIAVITLGTKQLRPDYQVFGLTTKDLQPMENIVALGFNQGRQNLSYLKGNITSLSRADGLIQYDSAVNPGCSGGPLISLKHKKVVAMVVAEELTQNGSRGGGTQLAIPVETILRNIPKTVHPYLKSLQ